MTTPLSFLLHPAAQTLGWTLLHFLWQGAVLGLLAWLTLFLLRGANAKARYGLACAFLLLMVAAPVATFLLLQQPGQAASGLPVLAAEPGVMNGAVPMHLTQQVKAWLDPSLPWLLLGWAAGVLILSIRFLGSWVRVQRLRRRSAVPVPAEWHLVLSRLCRELRLSRTVRLLQSAAVEVPTALGWLRPMILLPACALTGLAPCSWRPSWPTSWPHIRRGDFLVNLLQSLVEVLLFYHPAVWWLSSRIRAERELCCDDVAAELCGDPLILARALTDLEALREPVQPSPSHLAWRPTEAPSCTASGTCSIPPCPSPAGPGHGPGHPRRLPCWAPRASPWATPPPTKPPGPTGPRASRSPTTSATWMCA
ncbi:MAG: M56 family metallopeptidase [Holophagaceae bacterium]|uniref:M56 family metallopeptidase n=1 Tax=Candidatus Geothrix skivensis TaxID=2954439 RepID=A0A9D7SJS1_9BACT|nr:M56 family metallopeptidase [Candidatus Geothrix skivensis]